MKSILIVDDDPAILDAIALTLISEGFDVKTSETGTEAEELRRKDSLPDLIILDVLLSGKDGRTIAKKLKEDEKTNMIPIIMVSAHPSASQTAIESGADVFLEKPFEIEDLLFQVEKFTSKKKKQN